MENQNNDVANRFKTITDSMAETFRRKNHDYGNSFSDLVKELGLVAGFVPILHKCNRLKTLIKGKEAKVKDESIRDTLLDMANYCILLSMELGEDDKE